jgi:hypothetical protein
MAKYHPAYTPDSKFIFPYPLPRPHHDLEEYISLQLCDWMLTGTKVSDQDRKRLISWCALTYCCQPEHKFLLNVLKFYLKPLPKLLSKPLAPETVCLLKPENIISTLRDNLDIIIDLLSHHLFKPYLTPWISKVSLASSEPHQTVFENTTQIRLLTEQRTPSGGIKYNSGKHLFVQHFPFVRSGDEIISKRDHFTSATLILCPVNAEYAAFNPTPSPVLTSLKDKLEYAHTLPTELAKHLYLTARTELLHLWHTDKPTLKKLFVLCTALIIMFCFCVRICYL